MEALEKSYNIGLVVLSVLVATTGAYVAIEIAQRVRESVGARRTRWLVGGSLAMGLGIWSMHFVAMLALDVSEPVFYDALVTALSGVAAVAGCCVAFAIFNRAKIGQGVVALASVFMGIAIAGMHYTGMAAMRMPGDVHYDLRIVAASVGVAIAVSYIALIITRKLIVSQAAGSRQVLALAGAALLMGLAVAGMHYTGMAAATFTAGTNVMLPDGHTLLGDRNLGVVVAGVSLALLILALAGTRLERWRARTSTRFESLLQLSPQVVWSANAKGEITECNQYWFDYTGLPSDGPIGESWAATLHPDDRERVVAAWLKSIQTGADLEIELRLRRRDGVYHSFVCKGRPLRDDRGEIIRWLGIALDIEDRKVAEQELRDTATELEAQTEELQAMTEDLLLKTEEAEKANRAKSEFLASMSHELRTPLNAIGGYAELLEMGLRGPLTAEQREDIGRIKRSQQHLLRLINDVLNFAKIDSGQIQYRIADVAVGAAIHDTETMIRPQMEAKGLDYRVEMCADAEMVLADRDKFQQILLNLLSNAVKFTETGGRVTLSCESEGETVQLSVNDTGIGIPPEKIDTIFEPFIQVDQRPNQVSQGVGLGLSISRDLARAMGGELSAESAPGKGSIFTLTLPMGGKDPKNQREQPSVTREVTTPA